MNVQPLNPDSLPPDRSFLLTEQRNPNTMNLHRLSVEECVSVIQAEDRTVFSAVEGARSALAAFIRDAEPRFTAGGRLIYIGAGTSGRLGVLDASEAPPTFLVEPDRVVGIIAGGAAALQREELAIHGLARTGPVESNQTQARQEEGCGEGGHEDRLNLELDG